MSDGGDCRTATAAPGLLKRTQNMLLTGQEKFIFTDTHDVTLADSEESCSGVALNFYWYIYISTCKYID